VREKKEKGVFGGGHLGVTKGMLRGGGMGLCSGIGNRVSALVLEVVGVSNLGESNALY